MFEHEPRQARSAIRVALGIVSAVLAVSAHGQFCPQIDRQLLLASDGVPLARFGRAVALHGDLAVVSAEHFPSTGSAYVFRHDGQAWIESQKLISSDANLLDDFGIGVAAGERGILVGAARHDLGGVNEGAGYWFRDTGTDFVEEQKITASDAPEFGGFGTSVAMSGDWAVFGAPNASGISGAAYVFHHDGTAWVEVQKLAPRVRSRSFGTSVAMDGPTIVVGAYLAGWDRGAAHVFRFVDGSWQEDGVLVASDGEAFDEFGRSVAVSGDVIVSGASGARQAYVFRRLGTSWTEEHVLTSPNPLGASFGWAVAVQDDLAIVTDQTDSEFGDVAGAAFAFRFDGSTWALEHKLYGSNAGAAAFFGRTVAAHGSRVLIGAIRGRGASAETGSAHFFDLTPLALHAVPLQVSPGGSLSLQACGGQPNAPSLLFLAAIDGAPAGNPLALVPFAGDGCWERSGPADEPSLAGHDLTFQVFAADACGKPGASPPVTVTFE